MKAHLVGGGMASLSAAAYLIKDGAVLGRNIHIYETSDQLGGCLRGHGDAEAGYFIPVGRVFERNYRCTRELLSFLPSVSDPSRSVWDEMEEFHARYGWNCKVRLIGEGGSVIDANDLRISLHDKLALARLLLAPEVLIEGKRIDEWFSPAFFTSNFWPMWVSVMGCLPQHSLIEMKRFMNRFLHLLPDLVPQTMIYRTRYHQQQTIYQPLADWLKRHDVHFYPSSTVTHIDFVSALGNITAQGIEIEDADGRRYSDIAPQDIVLVTNGSQIGDIAVGSMSQAPKVETSGASWALWDKLAKGRKDFGDPHVFFGKPQDSMWGIFTVTARNPLFLERFADLTGNATGRQGLVTFPQSNWLFTIVTFHQPHFLDQPEGVQIWWGYGVKPGMPGNFVKKPMTECSGAEILEEVLCHLNFAGILDAVKSHSTCIPCLIPEANSLWAVRRKEDRPLPVPKGSTNFGFIGQFTEVAHDAVFTMEYSVRSARQAVTELLKLDRKPPPPYQGLHDPEVIANALRIMA